MYRADFCGTCPDLGTEGCAQPTARERFSRAGKLLGYSIVSATAQGMTGKQSHIMAHDPTSLVKDLHIGVKQLEAPVGACIETHKALDNI